MPPDALTASGAAVAPAYRRDAPEGTDPSAALVASYRRAAERMKGLSFVNPALEVEAVGFAPWNGCWLGVLVTPWFMNLVLTPGDRARWPAVAGGAKRHFAFPAGQYEFIGARDDEVGEFLVCSLFSPVLEFGDHATARLVAELAREALFDDANAEAPEARAAGAAIPPATPVPEPEPARPLAAAEKALAAPLTKRNFLRGRFLDTDRDA